MFFVTALLLALSIAPTAIFASGDHTLFIASAVEHADNTVTLPLYRGISGGQNVYYIVLDASDGAAADQYRVNKAQKLANAANTSAVQHVTVVNNVIQFPGTVDFRPVRALTPNKNGTGFPPESFAPGAVGADNYSPLIQLPDGTILNAPQIANNTGQSDKITSIDMARMTVTLGETDGFQGGKPVKYLSTDASNPLAATLENATYAPKLDGAPSAGDDSTHSSRAELVAFVNGQTGANNPQRQGLSSAILDGLAPLNVLAWNPSQGRYSPLWDVHLGAWSAQAVASGQNLRQTDVGTITNLAEQGQISNPDGTAFGAAGFIVNCPIISLR